MESIRSCIVCGKKLPKERFLRIAKFKGGRIEISPRGGRGAYLCSDGECISEAFKGERLAKALRVKGKIDADTLQRLRDELEVIRKCEEK